MTARSVRPKNQPKSHVKDNLRPRTEEQGKNQDKLSGEDLAQVFGKSNVDDSMKETLLATQIGEFLFGQDLEEKVKAVKALQSTAKDLKKPLKNTQSSRQKNSWAPLRFQNQVSKHQKAFSTAAAPQAALQEEPVPETPSLNDISITAFRLKYFITHWTQITSDPVVLTWLQGYRIPFSRPVY